MVDRSSPLEKCFYIYTLYFLCRAQGRSKPAGADKKRQKTYFLRGILQRRHLANTSYTLCELSAAARRLSENVPEEVFFCHFFRRCRIHYESKECGGICLYWLTEVAYRSFEHTDVVVTRYVFVEAASDTFGVTHLSEYAAVRGCDSLDSVH